MGEVLRVAGIVLLGVLSAIVLIILYGIFIEPRLIVDTVNVIAPIPNLPPEWEGREIAVIADLQVGMWFGNTGAARKAVRRILAHPPALMLALGDFIYHDCNRTEPAIRTVQALLAPVARAGIPLYGVLGNHDYGVASGKELDVDYGRGLQLARALEAVGMRLLENQTVPLTVDESHSACPLYLVGIGSSMANNSHPQEALAQVPDGAPRFVIMHNPASFEGIPPELAPAAVAGHTHGGQIRLPGTPDWSYLSIFEEGQVHVDGWVVDGFGQPGNHLYVNRGIGFSDYPIRINCAPEVTRFVLKRA